MSKIENKLARDITAMLIWRMRDAFRRYMQCSQDDPIRVLNMYAVYSEAHNAAEIARRMLYNS